MTDYDKIANKYANLAEAMDKETHSHFHSKLPDDLKNKLIADIGCGSGQDTKYFLDTGATVYGIDISKKEISIASKKLKKGNFIEGSMKKLPYDSNTFDLVSSFYALQTSDNVQKALDEMVRIAKPGALITVLTKHPFRQLIEGHINNKEGDYFKKDRMAESHIFNRKITLLEPAHTMMEYFNTDLLSKATIEYFEEKSDYPASDQVIKNMVYPTYMILQYRKK